MTDEQTALERRWEGLTEVDVYGKPESAPVILAEIEKAVRAEPVDASTAKGRQAAISKAATVARIKVRLDTLGKDMVAEAKRKIKVVDQSRKLLRDGLDALKAETRAPVTAFEEAEKARVDGLKQRLESIQNNASPLDVNGAERTLVELRLSREWVDGQAIDDSWQEFATDAAIAKDKALRELDDLIAKREKAEAEAAELERLRKEKEAREQAERDERIRREAAAQAKRDAEAKAKAKAAEAKRAAEAKLEAERQAKRDAEAEAERAKLEAELAVKRERERVEAAEAAQKVADEKRAANEKHRQKVLHAAATAICMQGGGLAPEIGESIIAAIVAGTIPHVTINF